MTAAKKLTSRSTARATYIAAPLLKIAIRHSFIRVGRQIGKNACCPHTRELIVQHQTLNYAESRSGFGLNELLGVPAVTGGNSTIRARRAWVHDMAHYDDLGLPSCTAGTPLQPVWQLLEAERRLPMLEVG